jgi:hypothetical protein
MVGRHGEAEQDSSREPTRDRVGICHGTWVKYGACELHGKGSGGADGMPGDGMDVGDIGQMPCWRWCKRQSTNSDDGRGARSECDAGVEYGRRQCESRAGIESRRDRISINDGARGEHGHWGHGAGGTRRSVMTVGQRIGSVSKAWSVDAMSMSRTRRGNRAGTGSASMTVHGSSVGTVTYTVRGRIGHTACEGTDWQSETSVRCLEIHGCRGTQRVAMTAGAGELSGSASQGWSFDIANNIKISLINLADTGALVLTVHGEMMGLVTFTGKLREDYTACQATE